MGKYEKKRKSSWTKRLLVVLCVLLALLLVFLAGMYILADSLLGDINRFDENDNTYSPEVIESFLDNSEPVETEPIFDEAEEIFVGKNIVNVLLVGQDRREGEGPQRTDAMILCTINKSKKTITMTSFMRDVWVYIPDKYNQRLNIPYVLGGFELLNKTLDYNFGVSADYNVEIDFYGFMQAIDTVGGVDIELTAAEAKYLNENGNWGVEANQGWKLTEGVNRLTGSQALAYSRIRKIGLDFSRTNRQRLVLTALLEKAKNLNPTELYKLTKDLLPMLTTDMTKGEIFGLIVELLPILSDIEVVSQRIPADNAYSFENKNGAEVIVISRKNMEVNKKLLESAMSEE